MDGGKVEREYGLVRNFYSQIITFFFSLPVGSCQTDLKEELWKEMLQKMKTAGKTPLFGQNNLISGLLSVHTLNLGIWLPYV